MVEDTIKAFWQWFLNSEKEIRLRYDESDKEWLDDQFTQRIQRIEKTLNWEIGPYHPGKDTLVISPTVRENLEITRKIVSLAPKTDGWVFEHAKPRKEMKRLIFIVSDTEVLADNWTYRLTEYNRGEFYDIDIFINESESVNQNTEKIACSLVVEALLGEETTLEMIGYILPNYSNDNTKEEKVTPIKCLREHFDSITRKKNA